MMTKEKNLVIQTAKEAGKLILSLFDQDKTVETKGKSYNLVTEADLKSEKLIVSTLKEAFPEHSILAEEAGSSTGESEYTWVIDPLDGTNNYAHKFPFFSVAIALCKEGKPVIGVVYDPLRNELFHAEKGAGSFLNHKPVHVTSADTLCESILATGFYYERGEIMRRTLRQMETFFNKPIRGIRRTGSATLDLCYVATGRLDGFWELSLGPWDYAASSLIVTEAGGKITDTKGGEFDLFMKNVLASNTHIHSQILEVLEEHTSA